MILSAALDLGTTRIKGTLLDDKGNLLTTVSTPAPEIRGEGVIRESSPSEYVRRTEDVFKKLYRNITGSTPLGISSQRSSFLLWSRKTSRPVTPLISWMDRRALGWLRNNAPKKDTLTKNTGLPLSPYYAGPKLAAILEEDPELKKEAERGRILFGTMECYLIWLWTGGTLHCTDITMASRTLMFDLNTREWSKEKLSLFNIPPFILPEVKTSGNTKITVNNEAEITAIPADQPAAFYASAFLNPKNPVVNLGTGGFVMSLYDEKKQLPKGLLYTPFYSGMENTISYGLEGTVNGITASIKKTGSGNKNISRSSPGETYCIPDSGGTGSPYWNPGMELTFSKNCSGLGVAEKRRVLFEGIVFRVAEIIDAMNVDSREISLYGGLSRNTFLRRGLATCLTKNVISSDTAEGTLLGAALMAAGNNKPEKPTVSITYPSKNLALKEKYLLWREWIKKRFSPKI